MSSMATILRLAWFIIPISRNSVLTNQQRPCFVFKKHLRTKGKFLKEVPTIPNVEALENLAQDGMKSEINYVVANLSKTTKHDMKDISAQQLLGACVFNSVAHTEFSSKVAFAYYFVPKLQDARFALQ